MSHRDGCAVSMAFKLLHGGWEQRHPQRNHASNLLSKALAHKAGRTLAHKAGKKQAMLSDKKQTAAIMLLRALLHCHPKLNIKMFYHSCWPNAADSLHDTHKGEADHIQHRRVCGHDGGANDARHTCQNHIAQAPDCCFRVGFGWQCCCTKPGSTIAKAVLDNSILLSVSLVLLTSEIFDLM